MQELFFVGLIGLWVYEFTGLRVDGVRRALWTGEAVEARLFNRRGISRSLTEQCRNRAYSSSVGGISLIRASERLNLCRNQYTTRNLSSVGAAPIQIVLKENTSIF